MSIPLIATQDFAASPVAIWYVRVCRAGRRGVALGVDRRSCGDPNGPASSAGRKLKERNGYTKAGPAMNLSAAGLSGTKVASHIAQVHCMVGPRSGVGDPREQALACSNPRYLSCWVPRVYGGVFRRYCCLCSELAGHLFLAGTAPPSATHVVGSSAFLPSGFTWWQQSGVALD